MLGAPSATCFPQGHIAVVVRVYSVPWNAFAVGQYIHPHICISLSSNLDEVLQLIFYELDDPSPLTFVSQRFYRFSQDPYVKAHYFLTHYGPIEAMYYALGRGKVVTERVLDVCHFLSHHSRTFSPRPPFIRRSSYRAVHICLATSSK